MRLSCGVVCSSAVVCVTDSIAKRSEANFLIYLGLVWQNFRSEMMFLHRYTCSFTSQVAKVVSTVKNWEGGVGWGGGGGEWLPTSSIFTCVGATGGMSAVTRNVIYFQHSNINSFA